MTQQRFHVLDTYRYLAALGVVAYHLETSLQPFLGHPTAIFEKMHLFVDFFFVLSGFVLMHNYGARMHGFADMRRFMRKRLARVYPLHALLTLVFMAMSVLILVLRLKIDRSTTFDLASAPANLLLVHAWGLTGQNGLNYPSWSISAEVFVYLMFPLFLLALVRLGPWATLALAVGFALLMGAWRDFEGMRSWTQATHDFGNLRAVPSFMAGMALHVLLGGRDRFKVSWWLAHGAAAGLVLLMLAKAPSLLIVALIPGVIFLIAAAELHQPASLLAGPIARKLGEASYGTYLLHALALVFMVAAFKRMTTVSVPDIALGSAIVIALATGLAMLSFRYFENPLRIMLGRDPAKQERKVPSLQAAKFP
ncbi:MAG: acyltransferase [Hyphomicrobiales bacterium]|nr:acyltransferase [Hyphomicrobiales bacterium]